MERLLFASGPVNATTEASTHVHGAPVVCLGACRKGLGPHEHSTAVLRCLGVDRLKQVTGAAGSLWWVGRISYILG